MAYSSIFSEQYPMSKNDNLIKLHTYNAYIHFIKTLVTILISDKGSKFKIPGYVYNLISGSELLP